MIIFLLLTAFIAFCIYMAIVSAKQGKKTEAQNVALLRNQLNPAPRRRRSKNNPEPWRDDPMTNRQAKVLRVVNMFNPHLTKGAASDLVEKVMTTPKLRASWETYKAITGDCKTSNQDDPTPDPVAVNPAQFVKVYAKILPDVEKQLRSELVSKASVGR